MVGEITLQQIWHLGHVQDAEGQWTFSVNYKVPMDNNVLRTLLQGETVPPIRIADNSDLLGFCRVLIAEIRGRVEGITEIQEGDYSLKADKRLERLMRKPTIGSRTHQLICVGDIVGPGGRKVQEFQREFDLNDLSAGSRSAVQRLDLLGTENSYRIFAEKATALDEYPADVVPAPKKVSAFIGYRRSHDDTAKRLFEALQTVGAGTLFTPYLDLHEMRPGGWAQQIFREIDSSDVFVALVSPDYADTDTVGLEKYKRGVAHAAKQGWDDYFNPVFLGNPATEIGLELKQVHGLIAHNVDELSNDNPNFQSWLGCVAHTGLSRVDEGQQ